MGIRLLGGFSALSGPKILGAKPGISQPLIFAQQEQPPWLFLITVVRALQANWRKGHRHGCLSMRETTELFIAEQCAR